MSVRILPGDCRSVLPTLPANSVHLCITSPPYMGLRDYGTGTWSGGDPACDHKESAGSRTAASAAASTLGGGKGNTHRSHAFGAICGKCGAVREDRQIGLEGSLDAYVAALVDVFREVRRVLHPSGCLVLNLGDSHAANGGAHTAGPYDGGTGRAMSAGKPRRAPSGLKAKDLMEVPSAVAAALRADGWYLRSRIPWLKRSGMPESVTDRPASAVEYVFLLTKSARPFWDAEAVKRRSADLRDYPSWEARKSAGEPIRRGDPGASGYINHGAGMGGGSTRNFRNSDLFFDSIEPPHGLMTDADGWPVAIDVNPEPTKLAHFAAYPSKLVEPFMRAATSERGCCPVCLAQWERVNVTGWAATCACAAVPPIPSTVLDPFAGTFTTGVVAQRRGRDAIGIELNPEYIEMAWARLQAERPFERIKPTPDNHAQAGPLFASILA